MVTADLVLELGIVLAVLLVLLEIPRIIRADRESMAAAHRHPIRHHPRPPGVHVHPIHVGPRSAHHHAT
jgi:hypothetical protein